jgi:hypothetical protein
MGLYSLSLSFSFQSQSLVDDVVVLYWSFVGLGLLVFDGWLVVCVYMEDFR